MQLLWIAIDDEPGDQSARGYIERHCPTLRAGVSVCLKGECHGEAPGDQCDCGAKAASPLALRWRCSVCGTSAIMKISTLATVCDGERIRKAEPQGDRE